MTDREREREKQVRMFIRRERELARKLAKAAHLYALKTPGGDGWLRLMEAIKTFKDMKTSEGMERE